MTHLSEYIGVYAVILIFSIVILVFILSPLRNVKEKQWTKNKIRQEESPPESTGSSISRYKFFWALSFAALQGAQWVMHLFPYQRYGDGLTHYLYLVNLEAIFFVWFVPEGFLAVLMVGKWYFIGWFVGWLLEKKMKPKTHTILLGLILITGFALSLNNFLGVGAKIKETILYERMYRSEDIIDGIAASSDEYPITKNGNSTNLKIVKIRVDNKGQSYFLTETWPDYIEKPQKGERVPIYRANAKSKTISGKVVDVNKMSTPWNVKMIEVQRKAAESARRDRESTTWAWTVFPFYLVGGFFVLCAAILAVGIFGFFGVFDSRK